MRGLNTRLARLERAAYRLSLEGMDAAIDRALAEVRPYLDQGLTSGEIAAALGIRADDRLSQAIVAQLCKLAEC